MVKTLKKCKLLKAVTVLESENVISVAKKFHDFQERRIFVVDNKNIPVGIISIVDINDRVVAMSRDLKKTAAKDIMTYPIRLVFDINTPLTEVRDKMILSDNYYCPVISKGKLKGIINYSAISKILD
jgi:CBS domain-containing protein